MDKNLTPLIRAGACATGAVTIERLSSHMTPENRAQAIQRTPGLNTLLCAAFPYGPKEYTSGPLSLYARGADYHAVLSKRLCQAAKEFSVLWPGYQFDPWADVSPFPEVYAAALAGLGMLGDHGLLITKTAGSFVFLGFLATNAPIPETIQKIVRCRSCGACRQICPGNALDANVNPQRCLSALTQRRGTLAFWQEELIRQGGLLWGCDRCQLICPENAGRTADPLPEFTPQPDPAQADFSLSDRAFRKKYAGRAFVWRGVQPLRRNAALLAYSSQPKPEKHRSDC